MVDNRLVVGHSFYPKHLFSFVYNHFVSPPNGPELSCGGEAPQRRCLSARDKSRQIVTGCFARAKSSTAGSVSLGDWLGVKLLVARINPFSLIRLVISI